MVVEQLSFLEKDQKTEIEELKKSVSNLRRGIFQRHTALMKLVESLQYEINEMKYPKLEATHNSRAS